MKKIFFISQWILCLFVNGHLIANLHPGPGKFGLQGEFLYLRPCTTALTFAAVVETFTLQEFTVKSLFNENKHRPGYRMEGMYSFDAVNDVHVRFTHLNNTRNHRTADGFFIFPTVFIGNLKDNNQFRYHAIELLFGRWLFDCKDVDLELQGGILYGNLKFDELTIISGPSIPGGTRETHSKFWGVGPEAAISLNYHLPFQTFGIFSFAADGRAALLASKTEAFFIDNTSPSFSVREPPFFIGEDPGFALLNDPIRGVVPASDFRLGLNWKLLCRCLKINLESGYEWIFYHRGFGASNISFRGPYFVLGVDY